MANGPQQGNTAQDTVPGQATSTIRPSTTSSSPPEHEISALLTKTISGQNELYQTLLLIERVITSRPPRDDIARQVSEWTLTQIDPRSVLADAGTIGDERIWSQIGNLALEILTTVQPVGSHDVSIQQITTLIFWSTNREAWILPECKESSQRLLSTSLSEQVNSNPKAQPTITLLLEQIIRPAFSSSRSRNITTAGRKAFNPPEQALTAFEDDKTLKPWKFRQRYAMDVLGWVVDNSNSKSIEDNWHLITPPVLTLIDDETISNKVRGCHMLQILLDKVNSTLWIRTGLGKVFEDALKPALAYLPPLTDQSDAEQLLKIIYPTLLALCKSQFSALEHRVKRIRLLDEILRSGILSGLAYSGENVAIASLLLDQMPVILTEMGIQCIKHLRTLVVVLVGYLSDPFAFASPELLSSAIKALQSLILNAWPRLDEYCGEILKGVAICWQRLSEEADSNPLTAAKDELRTVVLLLKTAMRDTNRVKEMEDVLRNDTVLCGLLP